MAMADCFIYTNRTLCYTVENTHLRILDLSISPEVETAVDVSKLLQGTLPQLDQQNYIFRPVYYSDKILSSEVTKHGDSGPLSWLIVVDFQQQPPQVITQKQIFPGHQLFVRNNGQHLVYGSRSYTSINGCVRWGLTQLDLKTRKWSGPALILWDFAGSNLQSDICFEIFDDYLYCISNKIRSEPDRGKWNSFYQAIRFPVNDITRKGCQAAPIQNLWRRHAAEGAVDERWTSLQLLRDETLGRLMVVETRREWFPQDPGSQLTCYKKELSFEENLINPYAIHLPEEYQHLVTTTLPSDGTPPPMTTWDKEKHFETRPSENVHVGDQSNRGEIYTLNECLVRSYNASCGTFVDLIHELYDENPRLRLRARPKKQTERQEIAFFPAEMPNSAPSHLDRIVNPVKSFQSLDWSMDERTLVYSPGHRTPDQLRPVVLMSFDPGLRLRGLPSYESRPTPAAADDPGQASNDASSCVSLMPPLYTVMKMEDGVPHGFDMSAESRGII